MCIISKVIFVLLVLHAAKFMKWSYLNKIDCQILNILVISMFYLKMYKQDKKEFMTGSSSKTIDPDAFNNLNKVLNEIYNTDGITIPGNVTIDGTLNVKGASTFDGNVTANDEMLVKKTQTNEGEINAQKATFNERIFTQKGIENAHGQTVHTDHVHPALPGWEGRHVNINKLRLGDHGAWYQGSQLRFANNHVKGH